MPVTKRRRSERGDTLIEVLVAISVMGIATVGTFSLMNKGLSQMYDTMERAEVRMLLNRQIESLTYARDQYLRSPSGEGLATYDRAARDLWAYIKSPAVSSLDAVPDLNSCAVANANSVFSVTMNADGSLGHVSGAAILPIGSGFPAAGDGIWVQKIYKNSTEAQVPYTDFYIRACWMQNNSSVTQVASTIVRLYDK